MKRKQTVNSLRALKNKEPICMITAYDALFARLFDGMVDIILVGDSLGMSFGARNDTLSVSLDMMIYHTDAVTKGAPNSFVVCDMPFGSYTTPKSALENCMRVYKETSADAVKIEGGKKRAQIVAHLVQNGIAVMGHIGLMPQFVRSEGGYGVKGKDEASKEQIIQDAKAIEESGAFCLVIEGVKPETAKAVTESVNIPVIGIGAGTEVDGQVLVWSDMLGFYEAFTPKFVKKYLNGAKLVREAVGCYVQEVKSKAFPSKEHTY